MVVGGDVANAAANAIGVNSQLGGGDCVVQFVSQFGEFVVLWVGGGSFCIK